MTRSAALLLLVLLAAAPHAARAEPPDEKDPKVHKAFNDLYPAAFRQRVNEAIERGAQWLIRTQSGDGSWSRFPHHAGYPMGNTALAVLTLLECGIPKEHPAVVKAFEVLRSLPFTRTYSVAVLLMALDAKYAPARDPFAEETVDRYGNRAEGDPCANGISPEDLAWMKRAVEWLLAQQNAQGVWRYPQGGFDLSNTQFALLGLHAASRCGVKVPTNVWLDALRFVLEFQEQDGEPVMYKANEVRERYRFEWTERAFARGFGYMTVPEGPRGERAPPMPRGVDPRRATGSMTTAGLTCLIICQARLWRARAFTGQMRADTRRAVRDAMAWLQHQFTVERNPQGEEVWHHYYLYGLERSGILGRFRFLGTHDWYLEGAEWILPRMEGPGPGTGMGGGTDTCFDLLFLKRATKRMQSPVITPSGSHEGEMPEGAKPPPAAAEPEPDPATPSERLVAVARALRDLDDVDPDVAFQAVVRLGHLGHLRAAAPLAHVLARHKDADVRCAAAHALGRLQAADGVDALIDALDDGDALVRIAAEQALGAITRHGEIPSVATASSRGDRVRIQKEWRAAWAQDEDGVRTRLKQPQGT